MMMHRNSRLSRLGVTVAGLIAVTVNLASAEDRKLTPEQLEALAKGGDLTGAENQRPKNPTQSKASDKQ